MELAEIMYFFTQYGAIAIFIMVFLEYLNLPGFPAGVIMPLAGVMAARGNMSFLIVLTITIVAGLAGSLLLYGFGKKGGVFFLNAYCNKFPKQRVTLEKNLEWVQRKGGVGVFVAKLLPMVRTMVSIPAGVLQMDMRKYVVSSTLGIFIWNLVFVGAGYLLGDKVFEVLGI